jgi:hypothetical protein
MAAAGLRRYFGSYIGLFRFWYSRRVLLRPYFAEDLLEHGTYFLGSPSFPCFPSVLRYRIFAATTPANLIVYLPDVNVGIRNFSPRHPPQILPRPKISQAPHDRLRNSRFFRLHPYRSRPRHLRLSPHVGRIRDAVLPARGRNPGPRCILLRYAVSRVHQTRQIRHLGLLTQHLPCSGRAGHGLASGGNLEGVRL